ncbi:MULTISPECIES: phage tail assembly chaperone [unclassified Sinorhizobium]|uniref:phage tail assembly chaperone n=1 Tax=unclassified Sinorhizobium TaxID=2613772 RepID=UPI003523E609
MAEKKINGIEYRVEPMLATRAIVMQARLMRAAGPLAAKLPGILASRRVDATIEEKAKADAEALSAITDIFGAVAPEEFAALVKDICELAKIKRPSGHYDFVDFDGDFSGRLGDIIPVVLFVLKEQFGDFFSGALANGARAAAARA